MPTRVVASAATGIATGEPYNCLPGTEDTITLLVDWQSITSPKHKGTAVYTASWTAPLKAGIHSAQHWYYMGEKVGTVTLCHPSTHLSSYNFREVLTSTRLTVAMMLLWTRQERRGTTHSSMSHLDLSGRLTDA